jgi:hypothetical protein
VAQDPRYRIFSFLSFQISYDIEYLSRDFPLNLKKYSKGSGNRSNYR